MGEYTDIINKLNIYIKVKEKKVIEKKIAVGERTFMQVRDRLLGKGTILEEDFEKQIYIITILAGAAKMNTAFVGVQLRNSELLIAGYAEEGLINQHTAKKAVNELEEILK